MNVMTNLTFELCSKDVSKKVFEFYCVESLVISERVHVL